MKSQHLFSAKIGREISIFIENRPGTLRSVIDILREAKVNMRALSMSEGQDAGYVRIIADRVPAAMRALEAAGHLLRAKEVVLLEVANRPGGMASAIDRSGTGVLNRCTSTSTAWGSVPWKWVRPPTQWTMTSGTNQRIKGQ